MSYWKADAEVYDRVAELAGKTHPNLAHIVHLISIVFKEKASSSGGMASLGSVQRVSTKMHAATGNPVLFVFELAADTWKDLTWRQQEALLDHLLTSCTASDPDEQGVIKTSKVRPDIVGHSENLLRYGAWFLEDRDDIRIDIIKTDVDEAAS